MGVCNSILVNHELLGLQFVVHLQEVPVNSSSTVDPVVNGYDTFFMIYHNNIAGVICTLILIKNRQPKHLNIK